MKHSLAFIFFICSFIAYNQEDIEKYFSDDKMNKSKNIIKTNLETFIHREIPIYFERRVADRIGLELGAGLLLKGYQPYLIPFLREYPYKQTESLGYSLSGQFRYYNEDKRNSIYYHIQIKHKGMREVNLKEFTTGSGKQWLIGDHFKIDLGIGMGFIFQNLKKPGYGVFDSSTNFHIIVPIHLNIGYLF